jgi:uncharacterized protein YndB with AHSA1/START domain
VAENEIEIGVPPEQVWAVLGDAARYDEWVFGAQAVRDADEHWPAVGSKLHHRTGVGPLAVDDETSVEEVDPPRRLVLLAKVGAAGSFRVVLELRPTSAGTIVRMEEEAVEGIAGHVPGTDAALRTRNTFSLARLKTLSEGT